MEQELESKVRLQHVTTTKDKLRGELARKSIKLEMEQSSLLWVKKLKLRIRIY